MEDGNMIDWSRIYDGAWTNVSYWKGGIRMKCGGKVWNRNGHDITEYEMVLIGYITLSHEFYEHLEKN